jgi:hypothetical protein
MPAIDEVRRRVEGFALPDDVQSDLEGAERLADRLRGVCDPEDVTPDGLRVVVETHTPGDRPVVLVRVGTGPNTLVLVHAVGPLRPLVRAYQDAILPVHVPFLVTRTAPEPDCAAVFTDDLGQAEGQLRFLRLLKQGADTPVSEATAARVGEVLRTLAASRRAPWPPDHGRTVSDALASLDPLLDAIRPAGGVDADTITPRYTLAAMAVLVAFTTGPDAGLGPRMVDRWRAGA